MTGSSATGPVRLILREPPHLPFIQGWPGVPQNDTRQSATVQGAVEVRVGQPVKAKWVRVEIRKYEAVPNGASAAKAAFQNSWEPVGKVHLLWRSAENKEYDLLNTADFRFVIPLPQDLPPTVELSKISGIRYELVASVSYKGKGGLFKKDSSTVSTVSQTLRIVKYDLASAWPLYNQPEQRSTTAAGGQLTLVVDRNCLAFGPGDRMLITATVKSVMAQKFRVKSIELVLVEVLTIFPPTPDSHSSKSSKKIKAPQPPTVKRAVVAQARTLVGEFIGPGTETKGSLDLVVPTDRPVLTVRAKEFGIEYELSVEAALECTPNKIGVTGIPCIIGTFSRSSAQQAVKDIGHVDGFCPPRPPLATQTSQASTVHTERAGASHRASASVATVNTGFLSADVLTQRPASMQPARQTPSPTPQQPSASPPGSPPQVQGFTPRKDWRRSSSGTTATTTSHATTMPTDQSPGYFGDRASLTMPNRRTSVSPNINGSAAPGRSPDPNRGGFEDSVGGSLRGPAQRQSSQSDVSQRQPNSFGAWNSSVYECIVDTDEGGGGAQSVAGGHSRQTSRDSGTGSHLSADPRAAPPAAQSPKLPDIADVVPEGLPPEYAPPSKAPSSTSNARATSPQASSIPQGAAAAAIVGGGAAAAALAASAGGSSSAQRGISQEFMNATQEKEAQRRRYEEAQQRMNSGGPSSPPNGRATSPEASASGSGFAASAERRIGSPTTNSNHSSTPVTSNNAHNDDPIPYDHLFGSASAGPAQPAPAPAQQPARPQRVRSQRGGTNTAEKKYKAAVEEKDAMRRRYENAQRAVALNQASYDSPDGSDVDADDEMMGPAPAPLTMLPAGMKAGIQPGMQNAMPTGFNQQQQQGGIGMNMPAGGSSSSAQASTPLYMSAEEEKAAMRKRYDDAQNRVVSAQGRPEMDSPGPLSSRSDRAAASGSSSNHSPANYTSAADEKAAMQRRYNEAQQAVARSSVSPPPPASPPPMIGGSSSSSRPPGAGPSPAYMSATEEKDMMRKRYDDAQQRVTSTSIRPESPPNNYVPSASNASRASPSPAAPPNTLSMQTYMSAADEKEMMKKRYEDATSRVGRATSPSEPRRGSTPFIPLKTPIIGAPLSYDEIFGTGSSSGAGTSTPPPMPAMPSSLNASPGNKGYMSATAEKDMMRKRYEEAQNAVSLAGVNDSPNSKSPGSSGSRAPAADGPIPYDAIFGPAGGSSGPSGGGSSSAGRVPVPAPYLSAEQEKEQMRKRYEDAQRGVAHAVGSASPPPSGTLISSPVSSSRGPTSAGSANASSAAPYMSADQEKDMMRRRYEDATSAVRQAHSPSPGGSSKAAGGGSMRSMTGYPSGSGSGSGAGSASPSASRAGSMSPAFRMNGHTQPRSMMMPSRDSRLPDGPPPPLAPRPPREYIERI